MNQQLKAKVLKINDSASFKNLALEIFLFQYENNDIYRKFVDYLSVDVGKIDRVEKIPFMPIEFFKNFEIKSGSFVPQKVFESSGTTGMQTSKHFVRDLDFYRLVSQKAFEKFFGTMENKVFLALLPSYSERENSSLIFMVNHFMSLSKNEYSSYYLYNHDELYNKLEELSSSDLEVFLFGVTFALLDFSNKYSINFTNLKIVETGGMKGRGVEPIREEVHQKLKKSFGVNSVFSEYGMTELLSQAYITEHQKFQTPPWLKILIRSSNDPLQVGNSGKGLINIVDLANIDSCSFIATDDIGEVFEDGSFKISGRADSSPMRGCSLLTL